MPNDLPVRRARRICFAIVTLGLLTALAGCGAPVRVTWKTETEMNTAGFNLYRGTSPDGPFDTKVNTELIPPSSDPLMGKEYTFVDTSAQGGVTYYYELQEIERNGNVNRFGPISVRTGGLQWPHAFLLVGLAGFVLLIWLRGGRLLEKARRGQG
jgi:hypothetical protein